MLITDTNELRRFYADQRIWQGIPSIEVTKKGRIFVTFYSGGTKEEFGNYSLVLFSEDGNNFSEPIVAAYRDGYRCFDPCLWIDPLGRLWFTWGMSPEDALYASVCDDPDADVLTWSEPFKVGHDVMMNKPVVLSTGEWLFPIAVWNHGVRTLPPQFDSPTPEKGSFVYKTSDNGKTFQCFGVADIPNRHFDEHMILELNDGRLWMLVRTYYGIGQSFSSDRGKTWCAGTDSGLGGPSSRFHICRLKSGRILMINHVGNKGKSRSHLTALLSEDDGKTWCAKLLLDERDFISYPDVKEADDGYIYIVYDHERGAYKKSLDSALSCAREILMAKITENDILQGEIKDNGSYLKRVVNKLGVYNGPDQNPYKEPHRYTDRQFAQVLLKNYSVDKIIPQIFNAYPLKCWDIDSTLTEKVDYEIAAYSEYALPNVDQLAKVIAAIRNASGEAEPTNPIVERMKEWINKHLTDEISLSQMAEELKISRYYMCHLFKMHTGISLLEYRNTQRLTKAKYELIHTDQLITDIASNCGFPNSSYFTEVFQNSEKISPSDYRTMHKCS